MAKMQKYRFILFAYFPENMNPKEILNQAEERFGKSQGNEVISMKDFGVVRGDDHNAKRTIKVLPGSRTCRQSKNDVQQG